MSALSIGPEETAQIGALVKKAFDQPVTLEMLLRQIAAAQSVSDHTTRDKEVNAFYDQFSIAIPFGYKAVFTVEQQPTGMCRHLSFSSGVEGKVPNTIAVEMLMKEFGFKGTLDQCQVWPEEFGQRRIAINVLEPIEGEAA